jgi:tetratricopeptide (TPR) repeat protein
MSLWQKVKDFNSGRGIIAIILAVCGVVGAVYPIFFGDKSAQAGVNVTGGISTTGDNFPIVTGDNASITINITQDEYVTGLKQRIDETKKQLADKQATINGLRTDNSGIRADNTELRADIKVLKAELRDLQAKLDDRDRAFQQRLQELGSAERNLRELQPELPAEKFNEALSALADGDTSKADQLLAQVEADAQKHLLRAAKAAYQRGLIADNEVRYNDANKHFTKAINLDADNAIYLNKAAMLRNKMGLYRKAEPLFEKALAIRQQTLGENHADTAESYGNIASNLAYQRRYHEAEPLFKKAIAIMEALSLADHPNTHKTRDSLRAMQEEIKR